MPETMVLRASQLFNLIWQNIIELTYAPLSHAWHGSDDGAITNGTIMVCSAKKSLLAGNSIVIMFSVQQYQLIVENHRESDICMHCLIWLPQSVSLKLKMFCYLVWQ